MLSSPTLHVRLNLIFLARKLVSTNDTPAFVFCADGVRAGAKRLGRKRELTERQIELCKLHRDKPQA